MFRTSVDPITNVSIVELLGVYDRTRAVSNGVLQPSLDGIVHDYDADRAFIALCNISIMAVTMALGTCGIANGSCYAYARWSQAVTEARLKEVDAWRSKGRWWRRVEVLAYYDHMSHARSQGGFGACLPTAGNGTCCA
jgi:hypothetical protein